MTDQLPHKWPVLTEKRKAKKRAVRLEKKLAGFVEPKRVWTDEQMTRRKERESVAYAKKKVKLAAEYQLNRDARLAGQKIYNSEHKTERKVYIREYMREKLACDVAFKILSTLRSRTRSALTSASFSGSISELLGCDKMAFMTHLLKQFTRGMHWYNHGPRGWHLDYIRPLGSFDLMDPSQVAIACHYTNIQPLWAKDNLAKGDKWEPADE